MKLSNRIERALTDVPMVVAAIIALVSAPPSAASEIIVNTSNGTIRINGDFVNDINGTPFTVGPVTDGVRPFYFAGDLHLGHDSIIGLGNFGASFRVGNNVTFSGLANTHFDFDATLDRPGAGGGLGGSGGAGGAGGSGGFGSFSGGDAGSGGAASGSVNRATDGGAGTTGGAGLAGRSGGDGSRGQPGNAGINNPGGENAGTQGAVGRGGSGAVGGAGGARGLGANISNGALGFTIDRLSQAGGPGGFGGLGSAGSSAATNGNGLNLGTGTVISGGAGGTGGNGGGGGGGGGAGGQGGGGGGGYGNINSGGDGGDGGSGGVGGGGQDGGRGGLGGHGGGAFEIIADGRVNDLRITSLPPTIRFTARGAAGLPGLPTGALGSIPSIGSLGGLGQVKAGAGDGARGGAGGAGNLGGIGGAGSRGTAGAGGTIKIVGTTLDLSNVFVNTSGGGFINPESQHNGRTLVGYNNMVDFGEFTTRVNLSTTVTRVQDAARGANPHIRGSVRTPFIPDLVGGAELFGLFENEESDAETPRDRLDELIARIRNRGVPQFFEEAPPDSVAAIVRSHLAVTDIFEGFDLLTLVNLTGRPLDNPLLGVVMGGSPENSTDTSFLHPLLLGGFRQDPLFGGTGDVVMTQLDGFEEYNTLIPVGAALVNYSGDGVTRSATALTSDTLYIVPENATAVAEPGTAAMFLLGVAATWLVSGRCRTGARRRPRAIDVGKLLV